MKQYEPYRLAYPERRFTGFMRLLSPNSLEWRNGSALAWSAVALGFGIALYFSLEREPWLFVGVCVWTLSVFAAAWSFLLRERFAFLLPVALAFLCVSSGFLSAQIRTLSVQTPVLEKRLRFAEIEATVESIESLGPKKGWRVLLRDPVIEGFPEKETPRRIRIRSYKAENLEAGDTIRLRGQIGPPSPPVLPDAFDFQRQLYFQGIGAVGFAYGFEVLDPSSSAHQDFPIATLRERVSERISNAVSYPESAVIDALLTGQRGAIPESDRNALRDAGLAHMLAISGLHVGLMAGGVFFFVRLLIAAVPFLALRWNGKKIAALAAFPAALFYTLLAGMPLPTLRALLMTGLVLTAVLFDRSPFSLRLVAIAAIAILLVYPESLVGAGFQLSFAAVTSLIVFYDYARDRWPVLLYGRSLPGKIGVYVLGGLLSTLVAGTATSLFSLYHFQQSALYDLLANFLAGPVLAFVVMPAGLVACALMPLGLENAPLSVMAWGVRLILDIAGFVSGLPNAVYRPAGWPPEAFLCLVGGGIFLLLGVGILRLLCVPLFVAGLVLILTFRPPDILVSSKGDLILLRGEDGNPSLSSRVKDRFVGQQWLRYYGQDPAEKPEIWPREGAGKNGLSRLVCGELGCRTQHEGWNIAFSFKPYGLAEDCAWADLLVARDPVPRRTCRGPKILIDRFDVWRQGVHAIRISDGGNVFVETVAEQRGERPWTGPPRR